MRFARYRLNRIEKAKVTADTSTVAKIDRVMEKAERKLGKQAPSDAV